MNIDEATDLQKRKFFALLKELGIDSEKGKEKAKDKYKLISFTQIKKHEIAELIDILERKAKEKNKKPNTRVRLIGFFEMNDRSFWEDKQVGIEYSNYSEYLADEILRWFNVTSKNPKVKEKKK